MTDYRITQVERDVIIALLDVADSAWLLMDSAEETALLAAVEEQDCDALHAALDRLDEVATEAPDGYAADNGPFNARHMLRHLLEPADGRAEGGAP